MRCWQTWHWKKATKGSLKPSNYGFDPIRPRNVMTNCLTEFSRVWAYNPHKHRPPDDSTEDGALPETPEQLSAGVLRPLRRRESMLAN
jgi:hypothetical protein